LSDFATAGSDAELVPDVKRVLTEFHTARKPIALCCIAPVLIARAIPGVTITVGDDAGVIDAVRTMGAKHEVKVD
jgi:enhancing lycopene biosynthesis protein 2